MLQQGPAKWKLCFWLFVFLSILTGCHDQPVKAAKKIPRLMLWAWDRPEDMRSLPSGSAGVAYLCQTLILRGEALSGRPRFHPLLVEKETPLLAVTRIEVDESIPFTPSPALTDLAVRAILGDIQQAVLGLQIDFDARVSEREFYRELLIKLRQLMPSSLFLSMTALTSWALHDGWIDDLPVDEAVPMCFEMGAEERLIQFRLSHHQDFTVPIARRAIGISLREPLDWIPPGRRVYVFNHSRWNPETIHQAIKEVNP